MKKTALQITIATIGILTTSSIILTACVIAGIITLKK